MIEPIYNIAGKRIWVAGHRGMVGSALIRRLRAEQCDVITVSREQVDLRRQQELEPWILETKPQAIILAAATVGGILANDTRPAEFLYDNLAIELNVVEAARRVGVEKLLLLGSSCIYPRDAPQPMTEDSLLTGPLEPTNRWYAVAKISGIMLCQAYRRQYGCDFISAMPTNLYGPGDTFDLQASHVVPALLVKAHAAKASAGAEIIVWGSGTPRRELMYVDDLADALVFLLKHYSDEPHVNIGTGSDITIRELAETVAQIVGVPGKLRFDPSKPDGTPRKLLDITKMTKLGWASSTSLREGLKKTYHWFLEQQTPAA